MKLGLLGILTVIFVVSKLAGWIDWSWWLVFLPAYGGMVLGLLIFALAGVLCLAAWSKD
jgi:hypothetical protein